MLVLSVGFSMLASAANLPVAPMKDGFRVDFGRVARVQCPSGAVLPRPLLDAAACGDVFRVRARLAEGVDVAAKEARRGLEGRTALHHAAQNGDLESVRLLLEAGADPNVQDAQGNTPLHLLAYGERGKSEVELAKALLAAGADARIRNLSDATPLGALIVGGWQRIDPLRLSALPLGGVLDEAEAAGPVTRTVAEPVVSPATEGAGGDGRGAEVEVQSVLEQWAAAWAARDVDAYLAHYAADFRPTDGVPFEAWQAQRRERVGRAADIDVQLSDVVIRIDGAVGVAEFTQAYRSNNYQSTDRKRLVMKRADAQWRIIEESVVR